MNRHETGEECTAENASSAEDGWRARPPRPALRAGEPVASGDAYEPERVRSSLLVRLMTTGRPSGLAALPV